MIDKIMALKLPSFLNPPTSLADQVYVYLRTAILKGEIAQGEKIVELEIASAMGTSQGPVREALQRLQMEGIVVRQARSATFVIELDRSEIHELFMVRSMIEGLAIRQTVTQLDDNKLEILQSLTDTMQEAGKADDMVSLVTADMQFHRCLCEWSQRDGLLRAWLPLFSQIQLFVAQTHKTYFPDLLELADTHQIILDTLKSRDADTAQTVIKDHVMLIWELIDKTNS